MTYNEQVRQLLKRITFALKMRRGLRFALPVSIALVALEVAALGLIWLNQSEAGWQAAFSFANANTVVVLVTTPLVVLTCALSFSFLVPLTSDRALQWADSAISSKGRVATEPKSESLFHELLTKQRLADLSRAKSATLTSFRPGLGSIVLPLLVAMGSLMPWLMTLTRAPQKELNLVNIVEFLEPISGSLLDEAGTAKAIELAKSAGLPDLENATRALEAVGSSLERGGISAADALAKLDEVRAAAEESFGSPETAELLRSLASDEGILKSAQSLLGAGDNASVEDLKALAENLGIGEIANGNPAKIGPTLTKVLRSSLVGERVLDGNISVEQLTELLDLQRGIQNLTDVLSSKVRGEPQSDTKPKQNGKRLMIMLPPMPDEPSEVGEPKKIALDFKPTLPTTDPTLQADQESDFRSFLNRIPRRYRDRSVVGE